MKCLWLAIMLVFIGYGAIAQNEYAKDPFYDAFKKLYADGQNGFPLYKGSKLRSLGSFFDIHKTKLMLPGADSGHISLPIAIGLPSATFHCKVSKTLQVAQQREANLLAAIKTAYGKPLYEKKLTEPMGQFTFYRTQLYNSSTADKQYQIEIETYVVLEKGNYYTVLEIHGKNPPPVSTGKSKLQQEPDLNGRIKQLLGIMDNGFASEKIKQTEKTQYYTKYEGQFKLFGIPCTVQERAYENTLSLYLGSDKLDGVVEAKKIYEQLKAAFTNSGRVRFKPDTQEGTRTWTLGNDATVDAWNSKFTLILDYYNDPYSFSVSFLLSRKKQ